MVICLEQGADLNTTQLMPLPLTISCSSKIHIGFTFVVQADLGSPGQRAVKQVCVCVCLVICMERGADFNTTQLMPLPLTISCFSKIHIGFTFVVPADVGSSGQRAVKQVCVCVCAV